jgi:WXG100 family type VII secretion target
MPHTPIGSDSNESFEVTPQRLRDTAPSFYKASQDTSDLVRHLNSITQQLIDDMSSELSKSPDALERLADRWRNAMWSLCASLEKVGGNLDAAANKYHTTDNGVANSFTSTSQAKGFGNE